MTSHTHRLPGLDLLRAIAVVWVMLFHSFLLGGLGPDWSWLSRYGWMGVDLFFVLSGFFIGGQVLAPLAKGGGGSGAGGVGGGRLNLADFYWRRAWRILPAYTAVLLVYLWWPGFREAPGMEPWWQFATFTLNLSIDYGQRAAFSHAWSLCVEEHFYWLFPPLAMLLLRRPAVWKFTTLLAALVLMGIALRTLAWTRGMQVDPDMATRNWFVEDIYYPTWCRLDGLLCGISLAAWQTLRPLSWQAAQRHAHVSLVAGLLVMALSFWLFRDRVGLLANAIGWPVLSVGLGLLVFAAAGKDSLLGRRLPLVGGLVSGLYGWLAAISYSLYLVHKGLYHVVQARWGEQLAGTGWLAVLVYGGTAVLAGAALHYAVERPGLRWRSRLPARWRS